MLSNNNEKKVETKLRPDIKIVSLNDLWEKTNKSSQIDWYRQTGNYTTYYSSFKNEIVTTLEEKKFSNNQPGLKVQLAVL